MRDLVFLFTVAALAVGCGPGPDPALGDCSTRKEGAVIIGTGEDEFTPFTGSGVPLNSGNQGGEHIWLGLSCKNLGPKVTAYLKITDVETGIELSRHGLAVAVELEYDGKGSDLGYGIFGYIEPSAGSEDPTSGGSGGAGSGSGAGGSGGAAPRLPENLAGRKIKIEADVTDECKKPKIHAEAITTIAGG